jgi:hypothetical protein
MNRPIVTQDKLQSPMLTPWQAGLYLNMSPRTLRSYRQQGRGPRFARIGRRLVYPVKELDLWVESMTVEPAFYRAENLTKSKRVFPKRKSAA